MYEDADSMLDDGFTTSSMEYEAAQIYFSQSPQPRKLWVGIKDGGETYEEAVIACRDASFDWYIVTCPDAVKADHETLSAWAESASPSSIYAFTTADADVISGATASPPGVFEYIKNLDYSRTIGQYSTNQGGSPVTYPDNKYAIVAIMGYACGQNSGLAGSAFTLKFKQEVGIATEPLTTTQRGYIENNHGNLYLSYGNYYSFFEQGVMADGSFFDEKINLDMLVNNIQLSVADLLYGTPKVPQTEAGVTQIIRAINQACDQAVSVGFLGPGTWTGVDIMALKSGDTLPKGYMVQTQPLSEQSDADRQLRKSPSIYVAIKEAGAVHSVLIGVYVNR